MSSLPAAAAWDAASPGTSPSAASPTSSSSSASRSSATGSTGKNAGGFRHQFSNSANIELSIESIALMKRFEEIVGTPIDFHQDGYLFLLSKSANVDTFKKNVALQQKHGVDVRWVSKEDARELSPGLDLTGVKGATYCPSDGVADPNGVTMGFAKGAQALGVEIVRECEVTGAKLAGHRLTEVRTSKGDISTPILINAAGPWAKSIGRLLGVDVPVEPERRHIFIASPPGGGSWDEPRTCRPRADVEDPRHRFREHLLLPPRRRRIAVRHGRSG